ncbi:Hypothetical protein CAP_4984 [Chondromyces apiculatus DSM 436]|uniref:Uncharacterized protein n=1 Tax=Chondromyces apiculatus DSM 436 TaxID=1192034 RepID=A0A017TGE4_9BACT|nr:Hypothetical protein CAP_4984 [Chondromyces apiculatus DSM 436]
MQWLTPRFGRQSGASGSAQSQRGSGRARRGDGSRGKRIGWEGGQADRVECGAVRAIDDAIYDIWDAIGADPPRVVVAAVCARNGPAATRGCAGVVCRRWTRRRACRRWTRRCACRRWTRRHACRRWTRRGPRWPRRGPRWTRRGPRRRGTGRVRAG